MGQSNLRFISRNSIHFNTPYKYSTIIYSVVVGPLEFIIPSHFAKELRLKKKLNLKIPARAAFKHFLVYGIALLITRIVIKIRLSSLILYVGNVLICFAWNLH